MIYLKETTVADRLEQQAHRIFGGDRRGMLTMITSLGALVASKAGKTACQQWHQPVTFVLAGFKHLSASVGVSRAVEESAGHSNETVSCLFRKKRCMQL